MTALAEHGISLKRETPGEHRTACARCAEAKRRPRDDALAVKVEPDGAATWHCHRCHWKGGIPPAGRPRRTGCYRPAAIPRLPAPKTRATPSSGFPVALWRECGPIGPDTEAAFYLRDVRGRALPPEAGDLRRHPRLKHPSGHVGPALVALVTDALTSKPLTLHRTWIATDGSGKVPIDKPRLLWPGLPKAGGVVRLWPDDTVTTGLCVAEGVETALTAALGFGLAWAVLDAGNLGELPVLPGVEVLTIVADHDEAGTQAADACGRRWAEAGREVRVWKAPAEGADLNDYAEEVAA